MKESANWPCTVYGLREPGGHVRYVGQTRWTLNNRLKRHLGDIPKGIDDRRTRWINDVLDRGGTIEIFPIETDAVWHEAEMRWIAHFRQIHPDLLNFYDGGPCYKPGVPRSDETKARMSAAQKRNWQDPEFREKTVAGLKAAANTPEGKQMRRDLVTASWKREDVRKARIENRKKTAETEEFREKQRALTTRQMADPEAREYLREINRQRLVDPKERAKNAQSARNGWSDPVKRAERIENMRKARWPKVNQPEIPGL